MQQQKSANIYRTLISEKSPGYLRVAVLCVAKYQKGPGPAISGIQSCAVGDESTQEYTQLNAFPSCVSDAG